MRFNCSITYQSTPSKPVTAGLLCTPGFCLNSALAWQSDNDDATVENSVLCADYVDPDSIRVTNGGRHFQGANQANFDGAVTLYIVTTQPASGGSTPVGITNTSAFRYVRFLSLNGGYGSVAELEFYGYPLDPDQLLSTTRPQLGLTPTGMNLTVSWPLANANFTLQSSTNPTSDDWVDVTSPAPQIVGSNWQVSLPISAPNLSTFYRLLK